MPGARTAGFETVLGSNSFQTMPTAIGAGGPRGGVIITDLADGRVVTTAENEVLAFVGKFARVPGVELDIFQLWIGGCKVFDVACQDEAGFGG